MKRLLVIILALFMLASCAGMKKDTLESDMEIAVDVGASANSYTVNTAPSLTADYLLGIDDFGGSWAVNRFNITNLQKTFQEDPWTIGSGTPNSIAGTTGTFSGVLVGALSVDTDADAHTLTSDEYHGGTVVATGAAVYTLPAAAADSGYSGCVENGQGVTSILELLPASGDFIVNKGTRGDAATSIKSPTGVAGSRICYWSYDADDWYVIFSSATGTWAQ